MIARRIVVEGRVQGVGYRFFVARAARELGIRGWVRNLPDGRVEAEAASPDVSAMEAFLHRLREGPRYGRVDRIRVRDLEVGSGVPGGTAGLSGVGEFEIRG